MLIDEAIRLSVRACLAVGQEAKIDQELIQARLEEAQEPIDALVQRLSQRWWRIRDNSGGPWDTLFPLGMVVAFVAAPSASLALERAMTHLELPDGAERLYTATECAAVEVSNRFPVLV